MLCNCQELSAYCLYNFIDKEDRNEVFFYFKNNRMQTDLPLKIIQNRISLKWNTVTNCYSVLICLKNVLICLKNGKFATFVF